ncbi:(d)CMP kinase [Kordiimonas aquimaris]|uniref:(d)CMP kinase n=1 Tax=Kordiimonas aquimaris TaxID=707591 RepID=UPI0021D2417D|nr:(d)CMP kinase [Kordiimonas aquimaris]
MIIAIDGPAAAGKGTLARRLADYFNYAYLDTGGLYRAVGLSMLRADVSPEDEVAASKASLSLNSALFTDTALRDEATGTAASKVAAMPQVRANLLEFQRKFSQLPPDGKRGAVLDGRDIGTVVCPNADIKFFVTANPQERARRRYTEITARGETADYNEILADVQARDARDMGRKDAPLVAAADAHLLDTTELDIDAVFLRAVALIEEKQKPQ